MKEVSIISIIGQRIKTLRQARGMTQEELGTILSIEATAVEEMESSANIDLRSETIRKLCETFHAFPRSFLYDTEEDFWIRAMNLENSTPTMHVTTFLKNPVASKVVEQELGISGFNLLKGLTELNDVGISRALLLVGDLAKIKDYRKNPW